MYLTMSQWEHAQDCFEKVDEVFPESPEVLTNWGYSKMMQYYAGLPPEERARIGGEICCATFVTGRPLVRGGTDTDRRPLDEAIELFERALGIELGSDELLPHNGFLPALCNLGVANIMYPDASAERLQKAARLLADAERIAKENEQPAIRAQAVANKALALARLDDGRARQLLADAIASVPQDANDVLPLKLNLGRSLTGSDVEDDLLWAESLLDDYLRHTTIQSAYRSEAAALWREVRSKLGKRASSADAPEPARVQWAPVRQVTLAKGAFIRLNLPMDALPKLADSHQLPMPRLSVDSAAIIDIPDQGTRLRIVHGTVRMTELFSASAPAIRLTAPGQQQAEALAIKVGERLGDELKAALETMTSDCFILHGRRCWLYRPIGVAIDESEGIVKGIAIVSDEPF